MPCCDASAAAFARSSLRDNECRLPTASDCSQAQFPCKSQTTSGRGRLTLWHSTPERSQQRRPLRVFAIQRAAVFDVIDTHAQGNMAVRSRCQCEFKRNDDYCIARNRHGVDYQIRAVFAGQHWGVQWDLHTLGWYLNLVTVVGGIAAVCLAQLVCGRALAAAGFPGGQAGVAVAAASAGHHSSHDSSASQRVDGPPCFTSSCRYCRPLHKTPYEFSAASLSGPPML